MKITRLNYFDEYEKHKGLEFSDVFVQSHTLLTRATQSGKDWNKVASNPNLLALSTNQFEALELAIDSAKQTKSSAKSSRKEQPKQVKKAAPKPKKETPKTEGNAKAKSKAVRIPKFQSGKPVETLDPHLVILKSYRSLNGKTHPRDKVMALARRLVKQIEARTLRKASPYAPLIEAMRKHLFDVLSTTKGAQVSINIPESDLEQMSSDIEGQHQMKSVMLLRRYASMSGRSTTIEKARKLYNEMHRAIENEIIPQDDRYFDRVIEVMKKLLSYIDAKKEQAILPLLPAELSGVLGCACTPSKNELNGFDDSEDDTDNFNPVSSVQFMKEDFDRYPITGKWKSVFGEIEPGKHTVVFSKEKFGKTTTLVDFAGYLSTHFGPVLFIQKEEELSGTFQDKFERTQAANPNLDLETKLPRDWNKLRKYKFVFLDSVTRLDLNPKQLLQLQQFLAPDTTLIAILHATKTGEHRGVNDYVHDASQIVHFPEFGAAYGKGRFRGCTGELIRFAEPRDY